MNTIGNKYKELTDYLSEYKDLFGIREELSSVEGAVSCAINPRTTVAICGKTDSLLGYILSLIIPDSAWWDDALYSVPFKVTYGETFSVAYMRDGHLTKAESISEIPANECEFAEITVNSPSLLNTDLMFVTLSDGCVKSAFDNYISYCDYVFMCPNLSNAISIEYHALCDMIKNEWQQPERVRAIAIDIDGLSLPSTMMKALSKNLGMDKVLPYMVICDVSDNQYNKDGVVSLLKLSGDKTTVLKRTYSAIDTIIKKIEKSLEKKILQVEKLKKESESFSDRLNGFKAQAIIHIPELGSILDDDIKSRVFDETSEYIRFLQGKISEEIKGLSKDEMDAYVPVYYSSLISEFIKYIMNDILIPAAQKKFDQIIDEILEGYEMCFSDETPEELIKKTKIAKDSFFAFVDKTTVDKEDSGIGIIESAILAFLVYEFPYLFFFREEILAFTNLIKRGIANVYRNYILSDESYAKEISNRVNKVLDQNLRNIPTQIEDAVFPSLEKNMKKALENYVYEAAIPLEEIFSEKQKEIEALQLSINDISNIKNNVDGLVTKIN